MVEDLPKTMRQIYTVATRIRMHSVYTTSVHGPVTVQCTRWLQAKVGTRYFFLRPLPFVRYLEIVLPLRAGPLFSKMC
jgi:hypothetical protein